MANKKQRALELAKTEARISGIPKGGSTRTGMTKAEKLAYEAALVAMPIGAGAKLAKTGYRTASKIARSGKLGKNIATKARRKKKIQLAEKSREVPKIEPQLRTIYDTGHRFGRKMPPLKELDEMSWEELKRAAGKEGAESMEKWLDRQVMKTYKRERARFHPEHPTVHKKGGSVKRKAYANGGSVRAAKF